MLDRLPKPFYQTEDGMQTIYCGDSLELLPLISERIDIILTDPPYGMDYHSGRYKHGNPHSKVTGDDGGYPVGILRQCLWIANKAVYAFCRWENLAKLPIPRSFIVWAKNNWTAGDLKHSYGRQWEGVAFYPREFHEFAKRPPDIIFCDKISSGDLQHPTQKPVELIKTIILNEKAGTYLDPFCGVGTTLVACQELGRRGIGIEIEEKYCEIAKKRLRQMVLPGINS